MYSPTASIVGHRGVFELSPCLSVCLDVDVSLDVDDDRADFELHIFVFFM